MSRSWSRAVINPLALVGAVLPGRFRRRPPIPAGGGAPALPTAHESAAPGDPAGRRAPTQQVFEATARSFDGASVRISATTSPGNHAFGVRPPPESGGQPEPPGSLSIAEGSGHPAEQRGRPITWLVVAFICLAFIVAGFGIVYATVWLFVAGAAAVVAGGLAGWLFGVMDDRGVGGSITRHRTTGELHQRQADER